jgi:tRNA nucleotidyltransferase (CCA-adding enzyme)
VFAEIAKAMREEHPQVFIETLRKLGVLAIILPELDRLFGIPQPPKYHPEIDTGIHSLMVLQQAAALSDLPEVRFAALLHDVGKGTTPEQEWPRHIAHEERGVPIIKGIARRLRLPTPWRDLAVAVSRYHLHCHRALELRPKTLYKTLVGLDALRRHERFEQFLLVCEADMRGRTGFENCDYPQADFFRGALQAARKPDPRQLIDPDKPGTQIAEQIARARIAAITDHKRSRG